MYKNCMKKFIIVALLFISTTVIAEEYRRDITTPPVNADEAFSVQVWVAIENMNAAQVEIEILNSDSNLVRNFFSGRLPGGYHKFFWDKKDNDGNFVPAGVYLSKTVYNQTSTEYNKMKIDYVPGEREVAYSVDSSYNLTLDIKSDTAVVSVWLYNSNKRMLKELAVKKVLSRGIHTFAWDEKWPYKYGDFVWKVTADYYTSDILIKRKPPGMK